jgi:hypothetical protein
MKERERKKERKKERERERKRKRERVWMCIYASLIVTCELFKLVKFTSALTVGN